MNKRMILIIIAIIIGVAGFLFLTQPPEEETQSGEVSNHTVGSSQAVVLVEYGDFQCPACGSYYPILKQVKEKYGDQITFQFRHFPLESIHVNARAASRAAEAAGKQGKFWEMHDILYETQNSWQGTNDPISTFESYAQQIGVADMEQFRTDYRSSEVNAVINADLSEGRRIGVNSTPTFVLNGEVLSENPPNSVESFSALIDEKLGTNDTQTEDTTQQTTE